MGRAATIKTMEKITPTDIQSMVSHWLATPLNGYLGSGYGQTVTDLLQTPLRGGLADSVLAKLRADVPILGALPRGAINMYATDEGPDKKRLFIDVNGTLIDVGTTS
jgi:hypothetical protein